MKKTILLIIVIFLTHINLNAQVGNFTVKTWPDNKKSAFSFTFDDSYLSQYILARPILNNHGFKGTFYIITGSLTDNLPGNWKYASWNEFKIIANEGHEVGSHTVTHPHLKDLSIGNENIPNTLRYEMYQAKEKIEEEIPGAKVITFAYPFTEHNALVDDVSESYYEVGRAGGNDLNNSSLTVDQRFSIKSKTGVFQVPRNFISDDIDDLNDFMTYINNAVSQNKWGTIMIHELYPMSEINQAVNDGAYFPVASEWLSLLCDSLKRRSDANDVWVETVANVIKYMRERDSFISTIVNQTINSLELKVTDQVANEIYDYPLTVDINVPVDWDDVQVTQNGTSEIVHAFMNGSSKVVRVHIIPDKSNVILRKQPPPDQTYTISGSINYGDSSGSALPNAKVVLTQPGVSDSLNSGTQGEFSFTNKNAGNYSLNISGTGSMHGVNSTDALVILRYSIGSTELDSMQLLAADVNNDNRINATDALQVLLRFSGSLSSFGKPDWIVNPSSFDFNLNSDMHFKISAILTGDVNKSYIP